MTSPVAVVLAAGQGTRMKSDLPKVLVPVRGRPMIDYVLDVLADCQVPRILAVVGYRQELVREKLADRPAVEFVVQKQQLGTGHAVLACKEALADHDGAVLVVAGDSPMIQRDSIRAMLAEFDRVRPACLLGTANKPNPAGLGRIVRDDDDQFVGIVEERDASDQQRQIKEVNLSCYVFNCRDLFFALGHIGQANDQGEMYLTDCPGILKAAGRDVRALNILKPVEALSINTMEELAAVEAVLESGAES